MAYHTGVYKPMQEHLKEKLIWHNEKGFEVWQGGGIDRWYLCKDGYLLSELAKGEVSFKKNYKGAFEYWIAKIQLKDSDKIQGIKAKIKQLKADIEIIGGIWE